MNKYLSQSGIAHMALLLLAGLGLIAFIAVSSSAEFKNNLFAQLFEKRPSFAAGNSGFSNLSAVLGANSAIFNFSFNGNSSAFVIDVSTDSRMRQNTIYSPFGSGTSSPIVVNSPSSLWNQYKCNATIYWRVNATTNRKNVKSSIQKAVVDCTTPSPTFSPTPTPTGIGSTAPSSSPTPTASPTSNPSPSPGLTGLAPSTVNTTSLQGADGTWCYDYDGKSSNGFFNVGYSSQSFCQDSSGIHADYCESGTATSRDYYCTGTWDGTKWSKVKCDPGGYVCSRGSYIGDTCTRGACGPSNPPAPSAATSMPTTKTLEGSDGTYCYDSDGNVDLFTKGACQDNRGIFTDYCGGSDNIQDYYCTGDWNGLSYGNVRCEVGTHGCTSQVGYDQITGKPWVCSNAVCILSQ